MSETDGKNETIDKIVKSIAQIITAPITVTAIAVGEGTALFKKLTGFLKAVTKVAGTAVGMGSRVIFGDISATIEEKLDKAAKAMSSVAMSSVGKTPGAGGLPNVFSAVNNVMSTLGKPGAGDERKEEVNNDDKRKRSPS